MSKQTESRRRFVPAPIETTSQTARKGTLPGAGRRRMMMVGGPSPELTPEPSPTEMSPVELVVDELKPVKERRRFAPQLIESSRRTFRLGDCGPATKPSDKTDITPYTNHIYITKPKPRRRRDEDVLEDDQEPDLPPTRRESEDEGVKEYLLELAAKEAERQVIEEALLIFPNSRAREGGVAHFYYRESSGSEGSGQASPADKGDESNSEEERKPRGRRSRRKSSYQDLGWWHKHMQDHVEKLAKDRDIEEKEDKDKDKDIPTMMRSDSDLDRMELPGPPDALWTTNKRILPEQDTTTEEAEALALAARLARDKTPNVFPGATPPTPNSDLSSAAAAASASAVAQSLQAGPGGLGLGSGPFAARSPFAALGFKPDEAQLRRLRKFVSPPMLGQELKFRKCPSPKQTKLETDHPFNKRRHDEGCGYEEKHRDISGQGGLWRGYCCRSESTGGYIVPADLQPRKMIATPFPPATPTEEDLEDDLVSLCVSEEPSLILSTSASSDSAGSCYDGNTSSSSRRVAGGATGGGNQVKGLHMLHGLDERLQQEKARAELDEKITAEFDDAFITQVYNYLSLGYPAMARSFDPELSKISRVSIDELTSRDDHQVAKGYMLEMTLDNDIAEQDRCPRWRALRIYIYEWARQHPDLDNLDPLAWGVRERRGSWAI